MLIYKCIIIMLLRTVREICLYGRSNIGLITSSLSSASATSMVGAETSGNIVYEIIYENDHFSMANTFDLSIKICW